ncbi:DUF664 domain-containing protein [Streptomyces sp. Caat 7-52]|uniref:mycothiol transferase n=1 Tax=Streptomyces sp. Caat 7-52 TaxID=2949637 RepID=UPI003335C37A
MPFSRARYGCAAGARYWRVGWSTVRTHSAEQSARYREPVAGSSHDKLAQRAVRDGLDVDLRRILLRPTEETARRNGHPDIPRELLEGTTGAWTQGARCRGGSPS